MRGRSCPEQISSILDVFERNGFFLNGIGFSRLDIDGLFTACGGNRQETITRFVKDNLGVDAIQVELASRVRVVHVALDGNRKRIYRGDPVMIEKAVSALTDIVRIL